MVVKGSFLTCTRKLLGLMKSRKGVQFVLIQETLEDVYKLYGLEDPDLDWSKATSGEMRVVMCISQAEISLLSSALLPKEAR